MAVLWNVQFGRWCTAVALSLGAAGCGSGVPTVGFSDAVARATGDRTPIEFRLHGEPVDVRQANDEVLTTVQAVQRALVHSPEIQAALARVRGAEADAAQARLLPNPILSVVLRLPEGGGSPELEAGLAADLVAVLSRPGRINAADHRLRAAVADALTAVLDVLSAVRERYVALQTDEELLAVLGERLAIVERLLDVARSRLELGEATRLDVLTLEAQRVELQTEVAERRAERTQDRLQLARLIGQPSAQTPWRVEPRAPHLGAVAPESAWVQSGLENRPEVLRQRMELAALGAEYRSSRWAPIEGGELGGEGERTEGRWAAGPAVSTPVPFFDFGQARRQKAEAALLEARHELTRVSRQVVEQVRRAYADFAASRENLARVQRELIPLARTRLEQAEAQFRAGQADVTALLLAEEELRAARTRSVELERRNADALIRLQRAAGGPGVRLGTQAAGPGTATTRPGRPE